MQWEADVREARYDGVRRGMLWEAAGTGVSRLRVVTAVLVAALNMKTSVVRCVFQLKTVRIEHRNLAGISIGNLIQNVNLIILQLFIRAI